MIGQESHAPTEARPPRGLADRLVNHGRAAGPGGDSNSSSALRFFDAGDWPGGAPPRQPRQLQPQTCAKQLGRQKRQKEGVPVALVVEQLPSGEADAAVGRVENARAHALVALGELLLQEAFISCAQLQLGRSLTFCQPERTENVK